MIANVSYPYAAFLLFRKEFTTHQVEWPIA